MKQSSLQKLSDAAVTQLDELPHHLLTGWFVLQAVILHVASFFGVTIVRAGGLESPQGGGIIAAVSLAVGVVGGVAGSLLYGIIGFGLTAAMLVAVTLVAKQVIGG